MINVMNSGTAYYVLFAYRSTYLFSKTHKVAIHLFSHLFHMGQKCCRIPRGRALNNKSQKSYLQGRKDLGWILKEAPKECINKKYVLITNRTFLIVWYVDVIVLYFRTLSQCVIKSGKKFVPAVLKMLQSCYWVL